MADMWQDAFAALLATMGESASYIPAGGEEADRVTLTAVIRRQAPALDRADSVRKVFRATIQVANAAHATYGGFAAEPAFGLKWKILLNPGDAAATEGWKAGAAQPARGKWMVPVEYIAPRIQAGSPEKNGAGVQVGGR